MDFIKRRVTVWIAFHFLVVFLIFYSTGAYVTFKDHDDLKDPRRLAMQEVMRFQYIASFAVAVFLSIMMCIQGYVIERGGRKTCSWAIFGILWFLQFAITVAQIIYYYEVSVRLELLSDKAWKGTEVATDALWKVYAMDILHFGCLGYHPFYLLCSGYYCYYVRLYGANHLLSYRARPAKEKKSNIIGIVNPEPRVYVNYSA